jgi:hypothetical protein
MPRLIHPGREDPGVRTRPGPPDSRTRTIDWTHPLTRRLIVCYLFNGGGGDVPNLARRGGGTTSPATVVGDGVRAGGTSWEFGRGIDLDGVNGRIQLTNPNGLGTDAPDVRDFAITAMIRPDFDSTGGGVHTLFFWGLNNDGDVNRFFLRWQNASLGWMADTFAQNLGRTNTAFTWTLGETFVITYQIPSDDIAGGGQWYKNGLPVAVTNNIGTPNSPNSGGAPWIANIGARGTGIEGFNGTISFVYIHKRMLLPAELVWLARRPYDFFVDPPSYPKGQRGTEVAGGGPGEDGDGEGIYIPIPRRRRR